MHRGLSAAQIDELMERACLHSAAAEYFDAERLCGKCLSAARANLDFERMARIVLPLQEARRLKREAALDAGVVALLRTTADIPRPLKPGCCLRETLDRKGHAASVLTREPLTRKGLWPIVGVGPMVIRVQVAPPWPVERVETSVSKDAESRLPPAEWFAAASEALGDGAIGALTVGDHPHYRVDDLLDFLDAHPEHEKLHQALEQACRAAIGVPEPMLPRRRGLDDPFSF